MSILYLASSVAIGSLHVQGSHPCHCLKSVRTFPIPLMSSVVSSFLGHLTGSLSMLVKRSRRCIGMEVRSAFLNSAAQSFRVLPGSTDSSNSEILGKLWAGLWLHTAIYGSTPSDTGVQNIAFNKAVFHVPHVKKCKTCT